MSLNKPLDYFISEYIFNFFLNSLKFTKIFIKKFRPPPQTKIFIAF